MIVEQLPGDWFGLAGVTIACSAPLIATYFTSRRTHRKVDNVREQVQNTHTTNLRDDIDGLRGVVDQVRDLVVSQGRDIIGVREDLGQLRGEVRSDRAHLSEVERKLDGAA